MPRRHARTLAAIALAVACAIGTRPEATRVAAGVALPAPPGSE